MQTRLKLPVAVRTDFFFFKPNATLCGFLSVNRTLRFYHGSPTRLHSLASLLQPHGALVLNVGQMDVTGSDVCGFWVMGLRKLVAFYFSFLLFAKENVELVHMLSLAGESHTVGGCGPIRWILG